MNLIFLISVEVKINFEARGYKVFEIFDPKTPEAPIIKIFINYLKIFLTISKSFKVSISKDLFSFISKKSNLPKILFLIFKNFLALKINIAPFSIINFFKFCDLCLFL